jgi:restriction system protein
MAEDYEQLMRPLYERLRPEAAAGRERSNAQIPNGVKEPAACPCDRTAADAESLLARLHNQATEALKSQLLAHIYAQDHVFFENLIIDVLLAMGYGRRRRELARRLGRSHDGGIDGAISQDELGLDIILVQAKRLKPGASVSGSQVRDFVGSLEANQAHKGVFVTTGQFTPQARAATKVISRRVVLITGDDLTGLMIKHNIGLQTTECYAFKKIDRSYFAPTAPLAWAAK